VLAKHPLYQLSYVPEREENRRMKKKEVGETKVSVLYGPFQAEE
jgi:hypothetical protein